jgi:hypothetical protein
MDAATRGNGIDVVARGRAEAFVPEGKQGWIEWSTNASAFQWHGRHLGAQGGAQGVCHARTLPRVQV